MSQNLTYRLPLDVIATQLTISAGHTVTSQDINRISYDQISLLARVDLKSTGTSIDKITEFFTFTRTQVVNFYNSYASSSVIASSITMIQLDPTDSSFVELIPVQTEVIDNSPSYTVIALNSALANNKSMISIMNSQSDVDVYIMLISARNMQTAAITGGFPIFEVRRMTGHSAGTALTAQPLDSQDAVPSGITVRTGATISGEATIPIFRLMLGGDEQTQVMAQTPTNGLNIIKIDSNDNLLTLHPNEGITLKQIQNITVGSFDIFLAFRLR